MRPAQEIVATPAQTRQESILSRYYPPMHLNPGAPATLFRLPGSNHGEK